MYSIEFNQLRFFGYHGLFSEETVVGEEFELDMTIQYIPHNTPVRHIEDTINYAVVYDFVAEIMKKREDLLETIVFNIANTILQQFKPVTSVELVLKKLQPPIPNFTGNIGIRFAMQRQPIMSV